MLGQSLAVTAGQRRRPHCGRCVTTDERMTHAEGAEMSAGARLPGTPTPMHTWSGAHGLTVAGDTWGDPQGPLVVLQHGGGQTRHAWKGAGETLGRAGYHAVVFDARGHGDSAWAPADAYGPDFMVQDLRCVVAALGGTR